MSDDRPFGVMRADDLAAGSGLDMLRGMVAGRHPSPPIAKTLGFGLSEVDEGRAVFRGTPSPDLLNPLGTVHGGWTATLLDSAMACAVHTTLKPGEAYTSLEMKVNFVRAVRPDAGEVVCEGRVIHRGGQIATSEGTLRDGQGRLLAHGTETCLIFKSAAPRPSGT